ncbi:hypothetical protein VTN77DRAFT_8774 [Rasamsonia byssochlamydoides]|uniref:uncharacterized protein n=1 Tax=Rasamsonia byssochlamydoides TaxID=89139 RepID=UPI00374319E0
MVNYGQPQGGVPDRGYVLYITALVMVLVAALFVFARLMSRFLTARIGVDDITIVIALVCSALLTATINLAVVNGYGRPESYLTKQEMDTAFMWFFIAQVFYKMTLGFTKLSIVLLYLRIFVIRTFQRVGYVFLVMITIWTIGTIMATIFQCVPVRASWDVSIKNARCINKDAFWYAFAVTDTVTDFAIFVLPLRPILALQLPKREKIGLLAIFSIGAFVCVTSILRTVAVTQTSTRKMDESWDFIPRSTWTLVEANMGIICACLPMMRHPLAALFPRIFHGSSYGRSRQQTYGLDSLRDRPRSKPQQMMPLYHDARISNQSQERIIEDGMGTDYTDSRAHVRISNYTATTKESSERVDGEPHAT